MSAYSRRRLEVFGESSDQKLSWFWQTRKNKYHL
ncbi:hypothetical protein NC653_006751 [Populus alba x Populus x berolinensis]|uniref:Uncharacterized protein n=1 Tax=Populus alba x Populus x berolinensis TaxID=444605 RepID=A0AAD6REZ9_9ROSI|nr:hypothetical protein NC653_006751 [Populus alba x Populus x berolinensis]